MVQEYKQPALKLACSSGRELTWEGYCWHLQWENRQTIKELVLSSPEVNRDFSLFLVGQSLFNFISMSLFLWTDEEKQAGKAQCLHFKIDFKRFWWCQPGQKSVPVTGRTKPYDYKSMKNNLPWYPSDKASDKKCKHLNVVYVYVSTYSCM